MPGPSQASFSYRFHPTYHPTFYPTFHPTSLRSTQNPRLCPPLSPQEAGEGSWDREAGPLAVDGNPRLTHGCMIRPIRVIFVCDLVRTLLVLSGRENSLVRLPGSPGGVCCRGFSSWPTHSTVTCRILDPIAVYSFNCCGHFLFRPMESPIFFCRTSPRNACKTCEPRSTASTIICSMATVRGRFCSPSFF